MNEPLVEETTIDLKDLFRILKKQRLLICGVFGLAVIGATIISFMLPKVYEAETTLRIKQSKSLGSSLLAELPMGNPMMTKQQMSTYAEIMVSRTVIEEVIAKAYPNTPKEKIPDYEELLKQIITTPVRDTEILKIQVQARKPVEAQRLANTLVETFINRITYLARSEQKMVREFIGERLRDSKREMEQAEDLLEEYKREQKIVAPAEETKALVERMTTIHKLAAENDVTLASSKARLDNIKFQLAKEKVGFVAENDLIQQYKSKLAEQEVRLVGLLQQYTEKYPEVKALRAEIAETKERLNHEIARVINDEASSLNPVHQNLLQGKIQTEAEIAAASAQKVAVSRIIENEENVLSTLPTKEQGLVRVMRDATVAQEIYIMLAKRHEEARISEVMQPTDVQIIDSAVAPDRDKPIKPKKQLNVLIAAFLGLFVGAGLAFVLEYINKTISNAEDVQNFLDLTVLGNIPVYDTGAATSEEHHSGRRRK
ncbi:MAG TPA: GNVR domain-containing protein [Bacillota bacterium]|nr:GNVR domain-containing protein [Bacillota bacterium]